MKLIPRGRTKALLGLALVASSVAAVAPLSNTVQAGPGDPPAGPATISPASGALTGTFNLSLPTGASCPGDGPAGYRWGTYITPLSNDVGGMVFAGSGQPTGQPAFTSALRESPTGIFVSARTPGLTNGLIPVPIPTLQWLGNTPPVGQYNIGIACTLNNGTAIVNTRYWNTQITVSEPTPGTFTFATGVPAAAPVLSLGAGTGTEQTINIAQTGTVDSYTVNVTPSAGVVVPTVAPGATSFELTGLTLGTSYSVELVANKTGFPPATSAPVVFSAAATSPAPVVTALNVFEGDPITASWTQPAGPVAPVSYDVELRQGATVVEAQPGVVGLTTAFAVVPAGSYTVAVTPNYAAGSGITGQTGTDSVSVNPGALIVQELTVARPQGALILTQRCGVYGGLPAYGPADQFPGFPRALPAVGAVGATTGLPGTAPTDLATGLGDTEFPNYPLPNDDPADPDDIPFGNVTECGLDMGVAQFVTQGNLAGQFFTADGRLNQVTVLDTRDGDVGWTLRGDIEDRFTSVSNGDSFSGDYLGWQPNLTADSGQVGGEGPNGVGSLYDQTVTAAPSILPGVGFDGGLTGLTSNPVLASAPGGAGLGIATIDARLGLLIPTSVDAADYSATLTLTVA